MLNAVKERILRVILSGFTLKDGELLVSRAFLLFKGMKDNFKSLVCQAKKNGTGKWKEESVNKCPYYVVNSIPPPTLKRLELDFPQELLKELLVTHMGIEDPKVLDTIKAEANLMLIKEIKNYRKYLFTFYDTVANPKERKRLAKTYAILEAILPFVRKHRGMIKHFYEVLKALKINHNIPLESLNYFYKFITRIEREGLPEGLLHGLLGERSNHTKLVEEVQQLIFFFKTHGSPTSAREVHRLLRNAIRNNPKLHYLIKKIPDEKTVRDFLSDRRSKNVTAISLLDYNAFEAKILGYLPTYKPLHPLTRIFIDGYVIQVYCGDDKTLKPVTLVGVFIMDDFSRFVCCEIDEAENHVLIAKALQKFLTFTKYMMAYEVISDRHMAYQCKAFPNFNKFLKDNKLEWHKSKNPKRKSPLERWFESWQTCSLSKIVGYRGEGIRSRREGAIVAREVVLTVTKAEFLKGKNEMIRHLMASVDDYNRNSFFEDATGPLDLYRVKKPKHAVQLQEQDLPYFFWDKHRVSIKGSMVIVQKSYDVEKVPRPEEEGHRRREKKYLKKWFYRCADFDFSLINGSEVDAYHNPQDDRFLYLFERDSHKFICTVEKQLVARGASAEQTARDNKIIADFVISKTALHQAYVENIDKLHQQVKDLTGVKDLDELNGIAQAKKDADEYVGNKAGVTNPTREPKLRDAHRWKQHGRKPIPRDTKKRARVKTGIKDTLS